MEKFIELHTDTIIGALSCFNHTVLWCQRRDDFSRSAGVAATGPRTAMLLDRTTGAMRWLKSLPAPAVDIVVAKRTVHAVVEPFGIPDFAIAIRNPSRTRRGPFSVKPIVGDWPNPIHEAAGSGERLWP